MIIDIELELYNKINTALKSEFKGIVVYGEYVHTTPKFPSVTIAEIDNRTDIKSLPLSNVPVAAILTYEINIYSNKLRVGKQQCKDILNVIDSIMIADGFRLTSNQPLQNQNDATIYRRVARYTKTQPTVI